MGKRNDPETAEATMEGLAFPSPHSRAAGLLKTMVHETALSRFSEPKVKMGGAAYPLLPAAHEWWVGGS
jgi:hypothetical protein